MARRAAAGGALAFLAATAVFVWLGFPYRSAGERLADELERRSGLVLRFADAGPAWSRGPAVALREASLTDRDGDRWEARAVRVRPALSMAWLRGTPALRLEVASELGRARGVLTLSSPPGFRGDLHDVALEALPEGSIWPGGRLTGRLDAELDLDALSAAPSGRVRLAAREGQLLLRSLPTALPFAELDGELELGGDALARVHRVEARHALYTASARGSLGPAPALELAPLDLELELAAQPAFRAALLALGLRPDPQGRVRLRVGGTAARPQVR